MGHATNVIDVAGYRIITDPLLTRRVAHLRRRRPVPESGTDDVDLALLSHIHIDHIHLPSMRKLRRSTRLIVPKGAAGLVRKAGFTDITEVVADDRVVVGPVTIEVVHAAHKHGRGPHTRRTAAPVGYVVDSGNDGVVGHRVYFPGDTDLFDGMDALHRIDLALLPIWGWGSTLGAGHLDPARAARASAIIDPAIVVPIHWGTYAPEDGRRRLPTWFRNAPDQFIDTMAEVGHGDRLHMLEPGETVEIPGS